MPVSRPVQPALPMQSIDLDRYDEAVRRAAVAALAAAGPVAANLACILGDLVLAAQLAARLDFAESLGGVPLSIDHKDLA